jgi:hypothetical protein
MPQRTVYSASFRGRSRQSACHTPLPYPRGGAGFPSPSFQEGIRVTSRYEDLTGEPYETLWTIHPLLIPGGLYAPQQAGATE